MNENHTINKNDLWLKFAHSGSVSDYLSYRHAGDNPAGEANAENIGNAVSFRNSDRSQTP